MSLLLMTTETPSQATGLSPSWRPWARRSKSPKPDELDSRPEGLLVPKPTSKSSDSEESRSIASNASRRRRFIRGIGNKLKSSSNVSLETGLLQEKDFKQVEGWLNGFDKYNQLVTNQVSRDKSYSSEQFVRICKTLTKQCGDGGFIHALPEALFDLALLWCPAERMTRKPMSTTEPSWSWTGWEGAVNFPFDPTNCPDIRRIEGEFFRSEVLNFHIGLKKRPYTVRRERKGIRIQYPTYFHAPRGDDPTIMSNTLHFEASTISAEGFTILQLTVETPGDSDKEIACSELLDDKGQHCGVIMDYSDLVHMPPRLGPFEYVLLSRNRRCEPTTLTRQPGVSTIHPPGTPVWDGERFLMDKELYDFDNFIFKEGEWKMLNVMLIQWMGDGSAERVAVGRIHEDAWNVRKPVKRDIILK